MVRQPVNEAVQRVKIVRAACWDTDEAGMRHTRQCTARACFENGAYTAFRTSLTAGVPAPCRADLLCQPATSPGQIKNGFTTQAPH